MSENGDDNRLLTSRHVSFISFGGIVGTGLFIGIKNTLITGPIFSLLSYGYISLICYYIIQAVGEMSCFMPVTGSLCQFQFKFISDQIGFMNNFIYWLSWSITLALELSLICSVLEYWWDLNTTSTILIIWICLVIFNLLPVNYYGEIEFIVTSLKVLFMVCWIFIAIWLVPKNGFKYWNKELILGNANPMTSLVSSCFTFQSIESVALCSGEIQDIHKNLPRAIKYIVTRILIFYMLTLFLLTLMIPCTDPRLNNDDVMSSPFLIGLMNLGVDNFLGVFNFIILVSMISAANSNIYFGSRCLLSIAEEGYVTKSISRRINGIPYLSVLLTSSIGLISLFSKYKSINIFFKLLINLSATSGLLMWLFISISYIRFRKALQYNLLDYKHLSYTSNVNMIWFSYFSIISIILIIFINGWSSNDIDSFLSCYLTSIVVILGSFLLSIKWKQPILKPIQSIDIYTNQSANAFNI
ncbi:unnamed protein product [Candida verbasci]|uniref:Amino acid permease/ SLC12A domain-containing protein n=1 Tax=Candida verbasci TaxID=1227364 RepID=A0A9W4TSQ1_9ASCO|nr:unnamed protein product [Candida verbasci]